MILVHRHPFLPILVIRMKAAFTNLAVIKMVELQLQFKREINLINLKKCLPYYIGTKFVI